LNEARDDGVAVSSDGHHLHLTPDNYTVISSRIFTGWMLVKALTASEEHQQTV